jgi:predicted enzyme related to lactoylglutathione lyase
MTSGMRTVIYPVRDITRAKAWYGALLGVEPVVDESYYAQFNVGDLQVGLDPHGHKQGMAGAVCYWEVGDIKQALQSLLDAGGETLRDVSDVGGGKLIAMVKDADGNVIGLTESP